MVKMRLQVGRFKYIKTCCISYYRIKIIPSSCPSGSDPCYCHKAPQQKGCRIYHKMLFWFATVLIVYSLKLTRIKYLYSTRMGDPNQDMRTNLKMGCPI